MNVGTLTIFLGVTTSGINKAIRDTNRLERAVATSAAGMNTSIASLNASILAFGRVMTQFVTFPTAIIGGIAGKTFADFEFNLSKVTGLVNIASDQTKAWGEELKLLAPALGKAPRELSEALYFVTTGGIRGAETMDVLRISAKAAAAGLGETKEVADLIVSAMNAYGKENLSAARAADILVASVKEGKAEANALAQSMGIVLPVASKLGAGFDQVGAAMAAMTRTGTKAATAAMQTRQILNKMINPAKESEDALHALGSSFGELRHIIETEGILPALLRLNDLTKEYGIQTVADIFPNIRALAGILDILGANLQENIKTQEAITNSAGALNHAFEIVSGTFKFKVNQFVSQAQVLFTELGESIGSVIIPILGNLMDSVRSLSDRFKNLSNVQQDLIVKTALWAAAMGPIIVLFNVIKSSVVPVFSLLYLGMQKALKAILTIDITAKAYLATVKKQVAMTNIQIATTEAYTKSLLRQRTALLAQAASTNKVLTLMKQKVIFDGMFVASTGKSMLMTQKMSTSLLQQNLVMAKVTSSGMAFSAILKTIGTKITTLAKSLALMVGKFAMVAGFAAIIGILVTALVGWIRGVKQMYNAQEELNGALQNAERSIIAEKMAYDKLVSSATSDLSSREMRIQAIKRLNDTMPEYLGHLTEENIRTKEGKEIIDAYTRSIENRNKQQSLYNRIAEMEARRAEDLASGKNKELDFWERARKAGIVYAATGTSHIIPYINARKNALKEVQWQEEKAERTTKEYEDTIQSLYQALLQASPTMEDYAAQYNFLVKEIKNAKDIDEVYAKQMLGNIQEQERALVEHLDILQKVIEFRTKAAGSWIDFMATDEGMGMLDQKSELEEQLRLVTEQRDAIKAIIEEQKKRREYEESSGFKLQKLWKDYQDELASIERTHKLLGDSYDLIGEKARASLNFIMNAAKVEGALSDQRVKNEVQHHKNLELTLSLMERMSKDSIALSTAQEKQIEVEASLRAKTEELEQSFMTAEAVLNTWKLSQEGLTGKLYDSEKALKGFKALIDEIQESGGIMTEDQITRFLALLSGLKNWEISDDFKKFTGDMEDLNMRINLIGNDTDLLNEKLRLLKEEWRKLLKAPIEDEERYIELLRQKRKEIALTELQIEFMGIKTQAVADVFTAFGESIGKAVGGAENAFQGLFDALLSVVKKIGTTLISLGSILVFTKLLSGLGFRLLLAGTAIVALSSAASTAMNKSKEKEDTTRKQIEGWGKMAQGGVVPPGYPNDSYPAMLSSGEHVIPPKALPTYEKDINFTLPEGKWVIRGQDLHYIMREMNRKYQGVY